MRQGHLGGLQEGVGLAAGGVVLGEGRGREDREDGWKAGHCSRESGSGIEKHGRPERCFSRLEQRGLVLFFVSF